MRRFHSLPPVGARSRSTAARRPMRLRWNRQIVAAMLATGACAAGAGTAAEAPTTAPAGRGPVATDLEERIRSDLAVVHLRMTHSDSAKPRECADLDLDDLIVRLGGKAIEDRTRLSLERFDFPLLHALVIDTSASMESSLAAVRRAAVSYVSQLGANEQAMVIGFNDSVHLWQPATSNRNALRQAIGRLHLGARTSLRDAIYVAARELESHRRRPILVLLSDGEDTASLFTRDDIDRLLAQRPALRIFAINKATHENDTVESLLTELTEATGGHYYAVDSLDELGGVFQLIRDTLDAELVLTIRDLDPNEQDDKIAVWTERWNCRFSVVPPDRLPRYHARPLDQQAEPGDPDRPFRPPFPQAPIRLPQELTPTHARLLVYGMTDEATPRCAWPEGAASWTLALEGDRAQGCVLDLWREHGLLYDPSKAGTEIFSRPQAQAAPLMFQFPPFEALPRSPLEALDALSQAAAPSTHHVEQPALLQGSTLLELRAALAAAAFVQPAYRDFALQRLQRAADDELSWIADQLADRVDGFGREELLQAVRVSRDGEALLARAAQPSPDDLQPVLAAWHGDVPAAELFAAWEALQIRKLVAGAVEPDQVLERWRRLQAALGLPQHVRTVGLLVPGFDPACDCVGYWRVVLPRPSLIGPRSRPQADALDPSLVPMDLVPEMPLGFWMVRGLLDKAPELVRAVRERGYAVEGVHYRLTGAPEARVPATAFQQSEALVQLQPLPGSSDPPLYLHGSIEMRADATGALRPALTRLAVAGAQNSDLAAIAEAAVGRFAPDRPSVDDPFRYLDARYQDGEVVPPPAAAGSDDPPTGPSGREPSRRP